MLLKMILGAAFFGLMLVSLPFAQVFERPDLKSGKTVADRILGTEDSAMEEWRQGRPLKWTEISAEDVIYMDPALTAPVIGKKAYIAYLTPLAGMIFYDASEYVHPRVAVYGDTAVLTYNYHSRRKDGSGRLQRASFWNTTEVYRLVDGLWKIVHTHWSYIQHRAPARLDLSVPFRPGDAEPLAGAAAEIMRLERSAMERWRKGDPSGFLEICAPEVTYFDSGTPARIDGLDELKKEYGKRAGRIHYDVMDFVRPVVRVYGDTAVLFYQFFSTTLDADGAVRSRTPWNCTEVYAKTGGGWKIVHTHWSLIGGVRQDGGV